MTTKVNLNSSAEPPYRPPAHRERSLAPHHIYYRQLAYQSRSRLSTTRTFSHVSGVRKPVIQSLRKVKTREGDVKQDSISQKDLISARAPFGMGVIEALICVEGFARDRRDLNSPA